MLTVTEAARDRLLSKLVSKKAAKDEAMRFTRRKGGWKLCLERACPDDATVVHQGRNVLLMDQAVSKAMTAMALDVRQTDGGPRLTLRRTTK
jgi:hypothetical protein